MRGTNFSSKVIKSFLLSRGKMLVQNSPRPVCGSLFGTSTSHNQRCIRWVALSQYQHLYPVTAISRCGCQSLLHSSARVSKLQANCLLQHSRSFSSLSLPRQTLALFDAQRFSRTEHSSYRIHLLSPKQQPACYTKRFVGRSSGYQDENNNNGGINISSTRYKLSDRTKILLRGRVSRLQKNILHQKAKLRDKIRVERVRGAHAVRELTHRLSAQKENIKTIPNLLTALRMASAPVLAYLVVNQSFGLACGIFVLAGITDMLDGYIARNFKNQTTALGTALDPLADKLLVSFLTVSLTYVDLIPVALTVLILGRDAGLIAATFYIRYISLAPPRTLSRYFDVSHVTAKLYPSKISKVNTVLQLSLVASTLASPVFDFIGHPLLQALMYMTAATTFLSGADYMLTWRRRLQIIKNK